ncbi:fasciclin [Microbacterium mangrovi]|uniref:Fasciclin n=1 Tax=Microbacterium mangrovi TaxID=1348253 RepID=A0A0B2A2J0_9MICO|nr:fasciclin domain-containing protein [Microbacterium mangrovi]KHK96044.1 fasciclin [Microbacterium mangrovi]
MLGKKMSVTAGALVVAAAFALSGCSMSGAASSQPTKSMEPKAASPMATADPAANLVGPGCAGYAAKVPSGAGSIQGMSQDPVAVAASNNPMLTTLVSAVSGKLNPKVNLVDTLDGSQFTVFAPVDDAFKKVPAATIASLKKDGTTLTKVLTYHVVPGQIEPSSIAGTHKTVEGSTLTVTGSGDNLMVNGAKVVCGGVQTANATVYLIDSVLLPPAK